MTTEEYNTCVDLHSDSVYRFILKQLRNMDLSKDIVQDTFEKLWIKAEGVSFEKAKSYLYTTAYHTMIDFLRRERVTYNDDEVYKHSDYAEVYHPDLKERLNEALNNLPEIQKTVVLLRDYEGYSYQEIGEITSLTEQQVKVYIYRARVALKNYIVQIENLV